MPAEVLYLEGPDKESAVKISDYIASCQKQYKISNQALVRGIIASAKTQDDLDVESLGEVSRDDLKSLTKLFSKAKADWKVSKENRAEKERLDEEAKEKARELKDAEKKATEERKSHAVSLMSKELNTASKALAAVKSSIDNTVSSFLPEGIIFSEKTGLLTVKKGTTLKEKDIASTFAKFAGLNELADEAKQGAAEREAQFAIIAKKALPDTWEELFGNREKDLQRIKKGMAVYEWLKDNDIKPFGSMANMRKAIEGKVANGTDEETVALNNKFKKEVVDAVVELQEKEERPATQSEITEIKDRVKNNYGKDQYIKPKQIYFLPNHDGTVEIVAGDPHDKRLQSVAIYSINLQDGRLYKADEDGDIIGIQIKTPTTKQEKLIQELLADLDEDEEDTVPGRKDATGKKAAKKASKKASLPPKESVTETDPEEEESETEEDDSDLEDTEEDSEDSDEDLDESDEDSDSDEEDEGSDTDDSDEDEESEEDSDDSDEESEEDSEDSDEESDDEDFEDEDE